MGKVPAATTLLFAHGGGFCKEAWKPIIRRVMQSPMVQRVAPEIVTFDFHYHGSKRDESVTPKVDLSNPLSPRVTHPAQDLINWSSAEVLKEVQALQEIDQKNQTKTPLIGIGHSMGAGALWKTEVNYPGTFDGLILFEPVYDFSSLAPEQGAQIVDFLVSISLQRESKWPSREAAHSHFRQLKNFANWDRESLEAYLEGALVEENDGTIALACHPAIEASLYCHQPLRFSTEELGRPKCKLSFHYGSRTKMFLPSSFEGMQAKFPHIYTLRDPMPDASHMMVMDNPAMSATRILDDLAEISPFCDQISIKETTTARL